MTVLGPLFEPATAAPIADIDAWWQRHRDAPGASPIARAIAAGASMDRVGYAFASGYQEALRALFDRPPTATVAALAVTEEGGNHPRAIMTTLEGGVLTGEKKWATLTPPATEAYVAARVGEKSDGRPDIAVVRVALGAEGVEVRPGPPAPFVPEVSHASLSFEGVRVPGRLRGDGYADYVKPFRTVEDVFVHAAVFAFLARTGVADGWPKSLVERMTSTIVSLAHLAGEDPSARTTHIALAGVLATSASLMPEIDEASSVSSDEWRKRWERDRPLFAVAQKAREKRRASAWQL